MYSPLGGRNLTHRKFTLQLNLDAKNTKTFLENILAVRSRYSEEHSTEPYSEANAFNTFADLMIAGAWRASKPANQITN